MSSCRKSHRIFHDVLNKNLHVGSPLRDADNRQKARPGDHRTIVFLVRNDLRHRRFSEYMNSFLCYTAYRLNNRHTLEVECVNAVVTVL